MKRSISVLLALLFIMTAALSLTVSVGADFGDYGGDADYGGGDDYGDFDFDYDYDDYDDVGSTVRSVSSSVMDTAVVIIIATVIIIFSIVTSKKKSVNSQPYVPKPDKSFDLYPMSAYRSVDPSFSEEGMKEWIANSYVRLQKAWQNKDLASVQTILSDAYYAQMSSQLDAYVRSHRTNVIEHPAVLGVTLKGWKSEGGCDVIVAEVRARIKDYVIDDATGNVVGGDYEHERFMDYEWTLTRTSGVRTTHTSGTVASNCPNCGAPIDLNKSAVCPYCDSVIKKDSYDWVISSVRGVSQTTVR